MLSLLVTLATLAAITLTGDRRQIVGANDNHLFKVVQSAHYVMRKVLFDPNAAAKIVYFRAYKTNNIALLRLISRKI